MQLRAKRQMGRAIRTGDFPAYQIGIMHEWLIMLSLFAVIIVPGFYLLDYFMMPAEFLPKFALYRAISTVLALVQFVVILRSKPRAGSFLHVYFLSFQIGTMISLMTVVLGGFNSDYYAGLNLVIMATNLVMPWKIIHAAINSVLILALYLVINLISGLPFSPAILLNNLVFLIATASIAASINWVRFKLTKNEFLLLVDLETSRQALQCEKALVEERNESIKSLLDVSEQGFLSFGTDFKVSREFSKACSRIFGGAIEGKDISGLLYQQADLGAEFRATLQLFFSGKLKGEVVFDLLDRNLVLGAFTVEMVFKAVSPNRVMLALTDITAKLKLQAKLNTENERKILILNVVSNRGAFGSFGNEAKVLAKELNERLHGPEFLLRMIHTFKANAGFLGFRKTSLAAHELEGILSDRLAKNLPVDLENPAARLAAVYAEEQAVVIDALGSKWQIDADSIELPRRIFDQIEQQLKTGKTNYQLAAKLESYKMKPLSELFEQFPQMINDLALRLGKRIGPLVINVGHTPVLPEDYEDLIESFSHLIRNIVDHGIELPLEREAKGKASAGTVTIDSKETAKGIEFSFSDDGQGLPLGEIAQKAKAAGLINDVSSVSPMELGDLIFRDNFSTSAQITEISGRGTGLAAVKQAVTQMNGQIKVNTRQDEGTVFTINIPRIRILAKELFS